MRTLWILLRTNFLELVGSFRKKGKTSVIAAAVGLIILGLFLIGMFGIIGASTAFILVEKGLGEFAIYISIGMGLVVALMFGVTNSTRDAKGSDTDMLLAMPIPKSHIVVSKLLGMYLLDVLCSLVLLVPSLLIVVLVGGGSVMVLVRGLLFALLIPAIPLFISLIISALISFLKRVTKFGSIFSTIISLLVMLLYMFVVPNMTSYAESLKVNTAESVSIMKKIPPLFWLTDAIYSGDMICVILALAMTLIPLGLAIYIHARSLTAVQLHADHSKKARVYRSSSVRKAVFKMEFSRYFSSANYIMNTIFGVVFLVFIAGFFVVKGPDGLSFMKDITVDGKQILLDLPSVAWLCIFALIINAFGSITTTTPPSVSVEGKRIWISKTLPIATKDILNAKILVSVMIFAPFAVLSAVAMSLRVGCGILDILLLLLITFLFQLTASLVGMIFGLVFAKLDWKNEAQVIKSGFGVTLSMIVNMLIGLITGAFLIVALFLKDTAMISYGIVLGEIVFLLGLSVGAYAIITHYGVRKYESLNG
ncbi:MAG: hypothetical protein IKD90_11205 [Clostridiales bacterium]|nr:hypothetical protein [Clostridiales bacterium]